ncbi:MAG: radical SAM protein [Candidatus Aenigmarchaeota archaeon]|nr:radical SAM protein [Candidatus Aenigmarchaeota archaeon]NIP40770.1 radical SAM protein [Candidatus Aenigmarchaeota archaeon]NIQ17360.1 radical SAM protein [Candidatus Aenigmarchaeota archaeon]NIS73473.1 radical SAM protein [Candidatus Aenigmarchaeota archaeon]
MTSPEYPKELPSKTRSVCPECLKIVEARIFEKDGKVRISKKCEKHGEFEDVYWGDSGMYKKARKFAYDGIGVSNPNIPKKNPTCPKDCGLCSLHKSHTALANLVVTNRCDLSCWYCFFLAKKLGYVYEPSLEDLRKGVRLLVNEKPVPGNAVQITGGEPSMRDDVIEIIKMIKEEGVDHVQYNTNGIRFAQEPEFVRKVREAGVNTVYLTFDGVTPKTNPKNHWEIPYVLENARKAGHMGIVLVPTVIKSVNDHEIGEILKFGFRNRDVVRGVNYQPVSLVGRMPRKEREKFRITIPDNIKKIEEQTNGEISKEDFYPVPSMKAITNFVEALVKRPQYSLSTHFACGMATYVFEEEGKMVPITRFVDIEGLFEYLEEKAKELREGKSKYVVGAKMLYKLNSFIDRKKSPKDFSLGKMIYNALIKHDYTALGVFHHRSMFIGMMHFMDKFNFDIERVKRCCIHYLMTDGRIIPFCTFNVIPEWYRDVKQKSQGISIKEWEQETGKKIKNDLHRRNTKKLESSELYKKTYAGFL